MLEGQKLLRNKLIHVINVCVPDVIFCKKKKERKKDQYNISLLCIISWY